MKRRFTEIDIFATEDRKWNQIAAVDVNLQRQLKAEADSEMKKAKKLLKAKRSPTCANNGTTDKDSSKLNVSYLRFMTIQCFSA